MDFADKLTNFLDRRKILILIFWSMMSVLLIGLYAGNFFNVTTNEFDPPEGTDAYEANQLINEYFKMTKLLEMFIYDN